MKKRKVSWLAGWPNVDNFASASLAVALPHLMANSQCYRQAQLSIQLYSLYTSFLWIAQEDVRAVGGLWNTRWAKEISEMSTGNIVLSKSVRLCIRPLCPFFMSLAFASEEYQSDAKWVHRMLNESHFDFHGNTKVYSNKLGNDKLLSKCLSCFNRY